MAGRRPQAATRSSVGLWSSPAYVSCRDDRSGEAQAPTSYLCDLMCVPVSTSASARPHGPRCRGDPGRERGIVVHLNVDAARIDLSRDRLARLWRRFPRTCHRHERLAREGVSGVQLGSMGARSIERYGTISAGDHRTARSIDRFLCEGPGAHGPAAACAGIRSIHRAGRRGAAPCQVGASLLCHAALAPGYVICRRAIRHLSR
jgi:hypothetical protein